MSRSQCEGREFDPPRLHHFFWLGITKRKRTLAGPFPFFTIADLFMTALAARVARRAAVLIVRFRTPREHGAAPVLVRVARIAILRTLAYALIARFMHFFATGCGCIAAGDGVGATQRHGSSVRTRRKGPTVQACVGIQADARVGDNVSNELRSESGGSSESGGATDLPKYVRYAAASSVVRKDNRRAGRCDERGPDLENPDIIGGGAGVLEREDSGQPGRRREAINAWRENHSTQILTSQVVGGRASLGYEETVRSGGITLGWASERARAEVYRPGHCCAGGASAGSLESSTRSAWTHPKIPSNYSRTGSRTGSGHRRGSQDREGRRLTQCWWDCGPCHRGRGK